MKTKYYSYLLIILINSLLLMSACATDIRPIGQQIDDKKNQSVLQGKYNDKHVFDSSNISVNIYYGTALLTGQTKQQKQKEEAENLAKSTVGINKVYNYIIIGQPISIAAASTDTIITTKIIAKMFNNSKVDSNKIKIVTSNKNLPSDGFYYVILRLKSY